MPVDRAFGRFFSWAWLHVRTRRRPSPPPRTDPARLPRHACPSVSNTALTLALGAACLSGWIVAAALCSVRKQRSGGGDPAADAEHREVYESYRLLLDTFNRSNILPWWARVDQDGVDLRMEDTDASESPGELDLQAGRAAQRGGCGGMSRPPTTSGRRRSPHGPSRRGPTGTSRSSGSSAPTAPTG